MRTKPTFVIEGRDFTTLEGFYDEISRVLIPQVEWGRNLDAFNDILRGGFRTPTDGFILEWQSSELSKARPVILKPFGSSKSVYPAGHTPEEYNRFEMLPAGTNLPPCSGSRSALDRP